MKQNLKLTNIGDVCRVMESMGFGPNQERVDGRRVGPMSDLDK